MGVFPLLESRQSLPRRLPHARGGVSLGTAFGKGGRVMVQFLVDVTVQALANLIATLIITLITH